MKKNINQKCKSIEMFVNQYKLKDVKVCQYHKELKKKSVCVHKENYKYLSKTNDYIFSNKENEHIKIWQSTSLSSMKINFNDKK